MDTLFSRHRNAMVLVAVLFLQLVLLAFQVKRDRDVPLIRIWAVAVITPVEKVSSSFIRGVVGVWYDYFDLRQAREQNWKLVEDLARLKLAHQRLQEEALEGRRLRELVQFRSQSPYATIVARVIGSSASETSRVLFLDKGSEVGIRPNMAVITPDGIVGKVHRVFWGSAQVLVITDPDSGAAVMLESSRIHGALRGTGGFFCRLDYIINDEKVEVGERVITSGEDLIYPKGLPVGVVSSVKAGQVFKDIGVQPSTRLSRMEEVMVVVRGMEQETPARAAAPPGVAEGPRQPAPGATAPAAPGAQTASGGANLGATPGSAESTRARPATDADKLLQTYRAAQAQKASAPKPAAALPKPAPARTDEPPATEPQKPPVAEAEKPPAPAPEKPAPEKPPAPAPEKPPEPKPSPQR